MPTVRFLVAIARTPSLQEAIKSAPGASVRSLRPKALSIVTPAMTGWSASYVAERRPRERFRIRRVEGRVPAGHVAAPELRGADVPDEGRRDHHSTRVHVVGEHVTHRLRVEPPGCPRRPRRSCTREADSRSGCRWSHRRGRPRSRPARRATRCESSRARGRCRRTRSGSSCSGRKAVAAAEVEAAGLPGRASSRRRRRPVVGSCRRRPRSSGSPTRMCTQSSRRRLRRPPRCRSRSRRSFRPDSWSRRGRLPLALSFVTKASTPPSRVVSRASAVVGKSDEVVNPVR